MSWSRSDSKQTPRRYSAAAFCVAATPGGCGGGALGLDSLQQGFSAVFTADQVGMVLAPLLGQLAPKGLGQDGLGELVDAGQGVVDLLFDAVGVGEELVDAAPKRLYIYSL